MSDHGNTDGSNGRASSRFRDSDDAQQALAALFGAGLARSSREEVRLALRPVCIRARESAIDVADLVKLVKRCFASSELAASLKHAGERQQVLDRIVSVCIDEYYSTG